MRESRKAQRTTTYLPINIAVLGKRRWIEVDIHAVETLEMQLALSYNYQSSRTSTSFAISESTSSSWGTVLFALFTLVYTRIR